MINLNQRVAKQNGPVSRSGAPVPRNAPSNVCEFCGYEHELDDKYGCPNCNGEGLEMTPDLQRKRDDQPPLRQRIDMAISHIAKHGWYDSGDLRRLLLDCKARIEADHKYWYGTEDSK